MRVCVRMCVCVCVFVCKTSLPFYKFTVIFMPSISFIFLYDPRINEDYGAFKILVRFL